MIEEEDKVEVDELSEDELVRRLSEAVFAMVDLEFGRGVRDERRD